MGGEGHAVGAGVEQNGEVAGAEFGSLAVAGEEVPGLADGTYDVGDLVEPGCVGDDREDLVVGLVEGRADEVVHGGVGDDEVLGAVLLGVEDAGEQRSGLGDEEAAGLEEQVGVEAVEGRTDGRCVGCDAGCWVEGCVAVLDAEASSAVDVADVEAGLAIVTASAELFYEAANALRD